LYLYRTFLGIFLVFFLGFLFVVPARTLVLLELQQPKVDLVIDGMSELTSKYYLVLVGNYDKTYALYNPNAQNILIVQKDQVKALVLKNSISVFADRRDFRKTPWLGVRGDWRYAKDAKDAQGAVLGFEVNAVVPGSPAAAASIQPGDLLQRIGTVALDGTIDLRKVIERLPLKEQIPLVLTRGEQPFSLIVQLQIMP
jgi:C-terminal processing protease CtpA/Prc